MECGGTTPLSLAEQQRSEYQVALRHGRRVALGKAVTRDRTPKRFARARRGVLTDWPHAPVHRLGEAGAYMVTAGTYGKQHFFNTDARRTLLCDALLDVLTEFGWEPQAWAVLANHYHFVAVAPDDGTSLKRLTGKLHMTTAKEINRQDGAEARKVWHQYWDAHLTFQRSYLARINYAQ